MRTVKLIAIGTLFILVGIAVDHVLVSPSVAHADPVAGPRLNVVVLCSSCGIPGREETPHVVLLDQNTGRIWAYREYRQAPVSLGTIATLGQAAK